MRVASFICVSAVLIILFASCSPKAFIPLQTDGTELSYDAEMAPFYHGVASGDPLVDRVIIWTRVTPPHHQIVHVQWEVSKNDQFDPVWQSGITGTDSTKDYTVKVDVANLVPGKKYFYRFKAMGQTSVIGHTKTLPSSAESISLGIVSCSNYEFGYFNAFNGLVQEDVDLVLHLGDYIYEYGPDTYGDKAFLRKHLPAKEILSLHDYRTRYAQYRLDKGLQEAHRQLPFILIWDDHEIANNAYKDGAQNHQSDEGDYNKRKEIARQVYYEWQPIRESEEAELYRKFQLGELAEIFMLDERLAGRQEPTSDINDKDQERSMLGARQLKWLKKGLANSKAQWKIIGNQVIFSPCDLSLVRPDSPVNFDAWDGYASERDNIIDHLNKFEIQNTIFVTGDTHASWAFEVPANKDYKNTQASCAIEIATPSITSSNWNEGNSDAEAMMGEKTLIASNPHLKFVNGRDHGYTILRLDKKTEAKAEWHYSQNIKTEHSDIEKAHEEQIPAYRQKFFAPKNVDIAITNVNIITMLKEDEVMPNQLVLIKDGMIDYIGPDIEYDSKETIDGSDKYLMPGLTEMHAHIPVAQDGDDTDVQETLFLYLSQGITTIRGMLGHEYHLGLREDVKNGKILGPRIYTSSPSMNGNTVQNEDEARKKVRQYKSDGYDFLKIHPGIQINVWDELEKTAKEVNMPYAGHVPVDVGIRRALNAGYQTIDHMDGYIEGLVPADANVDPNSNGFFGYNFVNLADKNLIKELVALTAQKDVSIVPTQTLFTRWFSPEEANVMMSAPEMQYMSPNVRFAWRQNKTRILTDPSYSEEQWTAFIQIRKAILNEMDLQGVNFLLGSDAPQVMNVPGFSIHHEISAMADAGISPYKILHAGTAAPAKFFGVEGQFGSVQIGAEADLILLEQNPLTDLTNSNKITAVMVRGNLLLKKEIDVQLSQIASRHASEE